MKRIRQACAVVAAWQLCLTAGNTWAADSLGAQLTGAMIWAAETPAAKGYLHAGFRREFEIPAVPQTAALHIFAYTRYQLFINGEYVGRGPSRFQNQRPEYDSWNIRAKLRAGRNVIAALVHRDNPSGRVMHHAPGFTARLEMLRTDGTKQVVATDAAWQGFLEPAYGPQPDAWASFPENIDARRSPGDWTARDFPASSLPTAAPLTTSDATVWPALAPRSIPLLRETSLSFACEMKGRGARKGELFVLEKDAELLVALPRVAQAYHVLDIEADAGAIIETTPLLPENVKLHASRYVTRAGRQRWIGGDTWAVKTLSVRLVEGRAAVRVSRMVEVLYPFDIVGAFSSSDPMLDRVWAICVRSQQLLSEDAYVDCAERERAEWNDCDPPAFEVTRVAFAGPGDGGQPRWADPRLLAALLRRTALTQRADGMLKAHTCSERWDLHAIIEDRACDWVEGLRKYYEATGDATLVRELWPQLTRLLDWFLARRTERGLVRAREWIVWDNPMSYATCEGTANNAFVQRALVDAAWLAGQLGDEASAKKWSNAAAALYAAFNAHLWNDREGAYAAGWGAPELLPNDRLFKRAVPLKFKDNLVEPTLHANLFALDRGLVPAARRDRVVAWTLAHAGQIKQFMTRHFYFKLLYGLDSPAHDLTVLAQLRTWRIMATSPWQTTWELPDGGSKAHVYGTLAAHTLSAYVLGVRREAPVGARRIIIQPHLGDLAHASGIVVTEFGPVPVSWKVAGRTLAFSFTLPAGVTAVVFLPAGPAGAVTLGGHTATTSARGRWRILELGPGMYTGESK
jgi:alpha-L-rhamnosidase